MKTLGQVAFEELRKAAKGSEKWEDVPEKWQHYWESAAQALAAVVREECARIAEEWKGGEYPGGEHLDPAVMIAAKIRNLLDPKPESGK